MNWLRRLAANRLWDIGAVVVTVAVIVFWIIVLPPRWVNFDFNHYYLGGRMLLEGKNPYTTSLSGLSGQLGFRFEADIPVASYPPSFLWLFAGLALLPPRAAFVAWLAVEIGSLIAILCLTRRLLGEGLSSRGWLFVAALAITSRTVSYSLYFSQAQLLLAAILLAAYAAQRAGRHGWACLAVSAAGILKLYPFILLPWFVWFGRGTIRSRISRLLGATGFVAVIVLLTGPALWRDFLCYAMPLDNGYVIARNFHFSLPSLIINFGCWWHGFNLTPEASHWWRLLGMEAGIAVIATAYVICYMGCRDSEAEFCLLMVAMLLGTVTVQGHYLVFLIFPLAVAAVRIAAKPTTWKVIGIMFFVAAANCIDPPDSPFLWGHLLLYIFVSSIPLYGLLGLGVFFWQELRSHRASAPHH